MEYEKITKLVQLVSESALTGLELDENGDRLVLKKEKGMADQYPVPSDFGGNTAAANDILLKGNDCEAYGSNTAQDEKAEKKETSAPDEVVTSPLVGTFYASPSEDAPAFVREGDQIKKGQTLAIVEAMKLMNEIESEYDGTIAAILVENGQIVEYGQPLFRISR